MTKVYNVLEGCGTITRAGEIAMELHDSWSITNETNFTIYVNPEVTVGMLARFMQRLSILGYTLTWAVHPFHITIEAVRK